ncbi:MAG: LapA family protein [Cyanobacteria bacterium P01_H01_bin.15]
MKYFILIILGAMAIFSVVFASQNASDITVNLLTWEIKSSLALVLIATLMTGVAIGVFAALSNLFRQSIQVRQLQKEIKLLEKQRAEQEKTLKKNRSAAKLVLGQRDAQA